MPARQLQHVDYRKLRGLDEETRKLAWRSFHRVQSMVAGKPYYAILGACRRTEEAQAEAYLSDKIYLKDEGLVPDGSPVISNARPWEGAHVFGAAFHIILCKDPKKGPWLEDDHPGWLELGEILESEGLIWGGRWSSPVDKAHAERYEWEKGKEGQIGDIRRKWTDRIAQGKRS